MSPRKRIIVSLWVVSVVIPFMLLGLAIFELNKRTKEVRGLEVEISDLEQTQESISDQNEEHKSRKLQTIKDYILSNYSSVPEEVADIIAVRSVEASSIYSIDYRIIIGVIETESYFNPAAKSNVGARGLMQVIYSIWGKKYNIQRERQLHNIKLNIDTGTAVLKFYLSENDGNTTKALQAYNGNIGGSEYSDKVYSAIGRFLVYTTVPEHE
jgi:soluble lytic murein transglycosylase-like protein